MTTEIFKGRQLVIATKHGKEKVIAPLFEKAFGVTCLIPENFDTDLLGTFTGEVERTTDPLTTARKKCLLAMEHTGCTLAIASEGSFGPHPTIAFLPADDEWMFFIDKLNGIEVYARNVSTATNFAAQQVNTYEELETFATRAQFPSHALILRPGAGSSADILKGIQSWPQLQQGYEMLQAKYGSVYAETDMRAMYNPGRMDNIEQTALKLVSKTSNCCPQCSTPGFGIMDVVRGLPCSLCTTPTRSVISYVYRCSKCGAEEQQLYPENKKTEDPRFCDVCNP